MHEPLTNLPAGAAGRDTSHAMSNTHLLVHAFDYYEPSTIKEAVRVLADQDGGAAVLAGGTFLLVQMKMERIAPESLISIRNLPRLRGIVTEGSALVVGGTTTIWELRNSALVRTGYAALADACAAFGSTQIQLSGTIGGNVCSGSPASDAVPALMALGAHLVLVGPEGERVLPIERSLVGPGRTAIHPGELLTAIRVPKPEHDCGSAFVKLSRVRADLAKASASAMITRNGDRIVGCRLALGAVGPTVLRARSAEEMLVGARFSCELALAAGRAASEDISPIDDVRSNARYRRRVAAVLTHDALQAAWRRSGGDGSGRTASDSLSSTEGQWCSGAEMSNGAGVGGARRAAGGILHLGAGERRTINLTVNGVKHRLDVRPNELLINVLRKRLHLTGTKYACGIGECGACTVHLDGVPTLSCLTLAVGVDGRDVTTVEGLEGPRGRLDPLQEAFVEKAAFQCGYCTPGMLMMTKGLLAEKRDPREEEIRDYLKGNRCRCTGFAAIVRAVRSCAEG